MNRLFWGVILSLTVFLSGCVKDDLDVNNATVKVGGTSYSFGNMRFVANGDTYTMNNNDDSGMDLAIYLYKRKVGSYDLDGWYNSITFSVGDDYYTSVSGSLTTTAFDGNTIEGSFDGVFKKNGKATDQYNVSGKFLANYSVPK